MQQLRDCRKAHRAFRPFCDCRRGAGSQLQASQRGIAYVVDRSERLVLQSASRDTPANTLDSADNQQPAARGLFHSSGAQIRQTVAAAMLGAALLAGVPRLALNIIVLQIARRAYLVNPFHHPIASASLGQ